MSLNKGSDNGNLGNQNKGAAEEAIHQRSTSGAEQTQSHTEQPAGGSQTRRSVVGLNSVFRRPLGRSAAAEAVQRYNSAFKEILKEETGDDTGIRLLVLDSNTHHTPLSALIVCLSAEEAGRHVVAAHTLIVESSAGRLNSRTLPMGNGHTVELITTPGDCYDRNMLSRVHEVVMQSYGRGVDFVDAGANVIPSELSAEDHTHVRSILFHATTALATVVDNFLGTEKPFTADEIGQRDLLSARLDYNALNVETAAGLPKRCDVTVTLQGLVQNNAPGAFEQQQDITHMGGFVDLVYSQPQPAAYGHPPQPQQYYPRLVLTDATTSVDMITMELLLTGLSTTTLLSQSMAWANAFRPRFNADDDIHDIGAIGYEMNLSGQPDAVPARIDTKSESFGQQGFYELMTAAVHPQLIYSMDVEETGDLSWIHNAFLAAASGDPAATQLIVDSANALTKGAFGRLYDGSGIARDDNNRIHIGYYTDKHGNKRDIRDIDYLAVLNLLGENGKSDIEKWSETFDRSDIPVEIRLERRAKMLQGLLGDSMVIKGYARRLTFNPVFIQALQAACGDAGIVVRPTNLVHDYGHGQRGVADAGNWAVGGLTGGMFRQNNAGFQQQSFMNPMHGGFWGYGNRR